MIYFDNAATTKIDNGILCAMTNAMKNSYGNPSSTHSAGIKSRKLLEKSRADILSALGVPDWNLIATSGATESNNLALIGFANHCKKGHIITVQTEHKSILESAEHLSHIGFSVTVLGVDEDGQIDIGELRSAIREDTILISFSFVNNETGAVQKNWREILKIAHEKNIKVHTDAVQAIGHINAEWGLFDMITATAHKIGGPTGIGCLLTNKKITLAPMILGGGQEKSLRGGTENVAGLYGFSLAVKKIYEDMRLSEIQNMKDFLIRHIKTIIPYAVFNCTDFSIPHILSVTIPEIDSGTLISSLDSRGICVSGGSACLNNDGGFSHVIYAMTKSEKSACETLRISFSKENTIAECEEFVSVFSEIISGIKRLGAQNE